MSDDKALPQNFAERYETVLVPVIFRPWAREIIRRAAPREGEDILDLACGTGAVTVELGNGPRPGSLTAADHNPDMLAVARAKAEAAGLTANWVEADAGALPFPNDRFDLAICQQALQFFPDKPRALAQLHRVLRPGGRAFFSVQRGLDVNPMLNAQAAALEAHVGPEAGAAVRAICGLPDGGVLGDLFRNAGFAEVAVEEVTLQLTHPDARTFAAGAMGGMHTGDKLSALGQSGRQKAVDAFLEGLAGHVRDGALSFPHASHVVAARA